MTAPKSPSVELLEYRALLRSMPNTGCFGAPPGKLLASSVRNWRKWVPERFLADYDEQFPCTPDGEFVLPVGGLRDKPLE